MHAIDIGDHIYHATITIKPYSLTVNKERKYLVTYIERNKGEHGRDIYHCGKHQRFDSLSVVKAD
ncbi:hypothetical protein SG34_004135 [Thalassomonas viridans]|uniref:Uncharacterized protein n=1 Tax=Thalassomonas viridans TaxID=137584 RepID=A0AAE9Z6E8_9GAMM|nr:hypothetical protein [Thalassomonas viridans]WDE06128.1 hypothetical protein SG34_004135 [Thalassomonas viridans]